MYCARGSRIIHYHEALGLRGKKKRNSRGLNVGHGLSEQGARGMVGEYEEATYKSCYVKMSQPDTVLRIRVALNVTHYGQRRDKL